MAQIPTVTAPSLTPTPDVNPRIASQPGQTIAGVADQMGSVADYGLKVAQQVKAAQDQGIVLAAENGIESDIQQAHAGLANWSDYTHADELKQQTADALHEKYAEQYGNRPDLWRVIEPRLQKELNFYNSQVDVQAAKLTVDFNQAALSDTFGKTIDKAALIPTLQGQELEWKEFDMKANAMALNRSITFTQAEAMKKQARSQTIDTMVLQASNPQNSPEVMQSALNRLKDYEGKDYVDPEKLERMQDHLSQAYEVASRRAEGADVSKQVDAVVSAARKDPTLVDPETGQLDYLKAAEQADANMDLPKKIRDQSRAEFEAQDGLQKRIIAERDQKQRDEIQPRLYDLKNPITENEIKQRALLPHNDPRWISRTVESQTLTAARQLTKERRTSSVQERMATRQETAMESAEILRQLSMQPGYIQSESELYQGDAAKLTRGDRAQLWHEKNIQAVKEYAEATKAMNGSSAYPMTPEGNVRLANDKALLRQRVEAGKLTGSQIMDEAMKIVKPQEEAIKHEAVKGILDNLWPVARSVIGNLLPGGGSIPVYGMKPATPAQTTEVPKSRKEYFDGMKKANPNATDEQINSYLDGKGIN
jgi:hypothetical protein